MIRAVIFDIGGVLEITPPTGWLRRWERELGLQRAELGHRLEDVSRAGSAGSIDEQDYARAVPTRLGLSPAPVEAVFLDDHKSAVAGAHAVGMAAILFRDNAQAIADLEALLRLNQ